MKSLKTFSKSGLAILFFFFVAQLFAQENKIENYKKWDRVFELLTAVQDSGALLLRLQDFENSKHYIKSNYENSTYKLYVDKLNKYNKALETDIAEGFTFCKVYVFNSKLSKYVLNDNMDKIDFKDPTTQNIKTIRKDTPHIFAQIKDLKLSGNTNPLNFSSQRLIQILDRNLQTSKDIDIQQDFFYHSNLKGNEKCPHILEAAKKLSHNMSELLVVAERKKKRLKKQILSKHSAQVKDYNKKISTMNELKEGKITIQHRARLNKEIENYRTLIQKINQIEKQLFE